MIIDIYKSKNRELLVKSIDYGFPLLKDRLIKLIEKQGFDDLQKKWLLEMANNLNRHIKGKLGCIIDGKKEFCCLGQLCVIANEYEVYQNSGVVHSKGNVSLPSACLGNLKTKNGEFKLDNQFYNVKIDGNSVSSLAAINDEYNWETVILISCLLKEYLFTNFELIQSTK